MFFDITNSKPRRSSASDVRKRIYRLLYSEQTAFKIAQ